MPTVHNMVPMINCGLSFVLEKYNKAIAYTIATTESYTKASRNIFLLNFATNAQEGINAILHNSKKYLKSLALVDIYALPVIITVRGKTHQYVKINILTIYFI